MGEVIRFPDQQAPRPAAPRRGIEPLWREVVGDVLREERKERDRTLADVAAAAGISTPYLSEIERGRKEPSSETLAAVAGALGLRLGHLTSRATRRLAAHDARCLAA